MEQVCTYRTQTECKKAPGPRDLLNCNQPRSTATVKPVIRLEHALVAVEAEHDVNVMLELTAPASEPSTVRPPIAIALVLDRSGSMSGEPLETAKRAAVWLVERLGADDRVSAVTFDNQVDLVSPP